MKFASGPQTYMYILDEGDWLSELGFKAPNIHLLHPPYVWEGSLIGRGEEVAHAYMNYFAQPNPF